MVQLQIFFGETAGRECAVRRFPFRIGRSAQSDLRLEGHGVWDDHLELQFDRQQGFILIVRPNALATINGHPIQEAILHNGDVIEFGVLKLRFWVGATVQASLRWREWLTWAGLALVTVFQIVLIYRLIR